MIEATRIINYVLLYDHFNRDKFLFLFSPRLKLIPYIALHFPHSFTGQGWIKLAKGQNP